jgi:RNA polymerase sigma-70 factor (TIGR02960 family)
MHTLDRARAGDQHAFRELTDPFRRELHLHCYRILGSVEDAEDLLQETLLAAWRGLDRFEGRASLRAWLYRIATNRSLNALRDSARRPRDMSEAASQLPEPTGRSREPVWLQPYPDVLLDGVPDDAPGPDARYETRETVSLAFVTALQQLPPRQRAVLVLRDVLGFRAAEVASILEGTEDAVNSALKRARKTLETGSASREGAPLPETPRERELVGRFADAWERGDVDGVLALLTDEARISMPPIPGEYQGHAAIAALLENRFAWRPGGVRLLPTRANGQPAFGCYIHDAQAPIAHAYGILVLTLEGDRISVVTRFLDNAVLPQFGLPRTLRQPA